MQLCGTCVQGYGHVANGNPCRALTHCQSGWCEGSMADMASCSAVCGPKRKNGEKAWQSVVQLAPSCESGMQLCGTCVQDYGHVPNEYPCRSSKQCQSNWCEGSYSEAGVCGATCKPKRKDGEYSYDGYDSSCISGKEQCSTCISGDRQIPVGHFCSSHSDCETGWCEGTILEGVRCTATCIVQRKDGEKSFKGRSSSCISGKTTCETCTSEKRQIPLGHKCTEHQDCQNGNCRGAVLVSCRSTCKIKEKCLFGFRDC